MKPFIFISDLYDIDDLLKLKLDFFRKSKEFLILKEGVIYDLNTDKPSVRNKKELEKLVKEGVLKKVDCFDCPKRRGNYCSFYLSTCRLAKRFCTICVTCKSANWINSFYKECEGCIIEYEKKKVFDFPPLERLEGIKDEGAMKELDDSLTRQASKPYLCQICKLTETCQNNFDYGCVEASDFLFTPYNVFTVKDDFLDSLIDKDNIGLRDKEIINEKELEKRVLDSLTVEVNTNKRLRNLCKIFGIGLWILMCVGYIIFRIIN